METSIKASEETKARFDNAQRILSLRQKRNLNQNETLSEILACWEAANIKTMEP